MAKKYAKIQIYSDGGARGNPGPAAVGVLICDAEGNALLEHAETIGATTNNVAEYRAVILALELAQQFAPVEVYYFADSELVVRQLTGRYRIKAPHISALAATVREKERAYSKIVYTHVPRTHEKIQIVDDLLNQALNRAGH
ncbi:MAG: hypothetical protein A2Z83_02940 [Omnitrophica bacterium GWA2_52_8]|nr:MAG: hypothetical protein A2Z83_02940 [Omnitrophica bacterium GWA2_52_8]